MGGSKQLEETSFGVGDPWVLIGRITKRAAVETIRANQTDISMTRTSVETHSTMAKSPKITTILLLHVIV